MVKGDPDIPMERKVLFQQVETLNNGKQYIIEISLTKKKFMILAVRKGKHYKLEFPKKQGKKILDELDGQCEVLVR